MAVQGLEVRSYFPGDEAGIVDVWNEYLYRDPVTLEVFERKVLLDPNFNPDGCIVALAGGRVESFILALKRAYPLFHDGLQPETGWITSFAVSRALRGKGVEDILVEKALAFLRARGAREVWFSCYTPNYFFPGVDVEAYGDLHALLKGFGFLAVYEALAMDGVLWPEMEAPEGLDDLEKELGGEGVEIRFLETRFVQPFLRFLRENFTGDWYRHSLEMLERGCERDQIVLAVKGSEVLGYCQHFNGEGFDWYRPGEHLGPFGVAESMRGRGLGTLLLYRCLERMRERGIHYFYLLWTEERAAKLYSRFGMRVARRFAVMKKTFEG